MYNKGEVKIYHTSVEPKNSGSRTFTKESGIVDIDELHKALLNPNNFVVIKNNVSNWSDATEIQTFINTDKLVAEDGFDDTFVFAHYGRSGASVTNRKIVMSFSKIGTEPKLKATYYST